MDTINKSKHIIEFEHLYKKGQKVWFLNRQDDTPRRGRVEIIEFDVDSGSVSYFVKEYGWFEEEDLFYCEKDLEERTVERIQMQIADARSEEVFLKRRLDTNRKSIKQLESSPWLAKATNKGE